jgi:hypothetical protein
MEATNCHHNSRAFNQLSRQMRHLTGPILQSEEIVVMDQLTEGVPSKAEVRIEFAMLSSQCKPSREWEVSTLLNRADTLGMEGN